MSEQPEASPTTRRVDDGRTDTPSGALKQVDAGLLSVGYAEVGPADGRVVVLLHGWPCDIHSYAEVTPGTRRSG
jgi:hypothetical protein